MTFKELARFEKVTALIGVLEEEIAYLRASGTPIVQRYGSVGGGSCKISDPTAAAAMKIESKTETLRRLKKERAEIKAFIEGVQDEVVRAALFYHFLRFYTWKQTAARLGGRRTEASVKMMCKRLLSDY